VSNDPQICNLIHIFRQSKALYELNVELFWTGRLEQDESATTARGKVTISEISDLKEDFVLTTTVEEMETDIMPDSNKSEENLSSIMTREGIAVIKSLIMEKFVQELQDGQIQPNEEPISIPVIPPVKDIPITKINQVLYHKRKT
jgi:hypothetical protein